MEERRNSNRQQGELRAVCAVSRVGGGGGGGGEEGKL